MSEKYEKCPNCDEKLTGMFSGSVVEDEVIREINEKIKNKILSKNIKILFQKTYDKRVVNFLDSAGFQLKECSSDEKIKLSNQFEIQIVKHDFYDSSISIKTPDLNILNINDCPINDLKLLKKFKKKSTRFLDRKFFF